MDEYELEWVQFIGEAATFIKRELATKGSVTSNTAFIDKYYSNKLIDPEVLEFVSNTMCNVLLYKKDLERMLNIFTASDPVDAKRQILKMMYE